MSNIFFQLELTPTPRESFPQLLSLLQKYEVRTVSLTDKSKSSSNLELARYLRAHSTLQITPHYSLQNHYSRDLSAMIASFESYVAECLATGITEVLVVSGSQVRRHTTVEFLQLYEPHTGFKVHVAHNPYAPEPVQEMARLRQKLPRADGVYLQIGEDLDILSHAVTKIRKYAPHKSVYGCLLYPTPQFQSRFRFRPWKGVYLTSRYLQDLEYAREVFAAYRDAYLALDVIPLLEVIPLTEENLRAALDTLLTNQ